MRIEWTPAAAIAARQAGVEIADEDILWDIDEPHPFECPDCEIVDPAGIREDDELLAIVCRQCRRPLLWKDGWKPDAD